MIFNYQGSKNFRKEHPSSPALAQTAPAYIAVLQQNRALLPAPAGLDLDVQVPCNTGNRSTMWTYRLALVTVPFSSHLGDVQSPQWLCSEPLVCSWAVWRRSFVLNISEDLHLPFTLQGKIYSYSLLYQLLLSNKFNILALIGDQAFGITDFVLLPLILPMPYK